MVTMRPRRRGLPSRPMTVRNAIRAAKYASSGRTVVVALRRVNARYSALVGNNRIVRSRAMMTPIAAMPVRIASIVRRDRPRMISVTIRPSGSTSTPTAPATLITRTSVWGISRIRRVRSWFIPRPVLRATDPKKASRTSAQASPATRTSSNGRRIRAGAESTTTTNGPPVLTSESPPANTAPGLWTNGITERSISSTAQPLATRGAW